MLRTLFYAAVLVVALLSPAAGQTKKDALVLYRQAQYAESIAVCLEEITANPSSLESHVVLCWALVAAGRYQEAETWAEKGRTISRYDPRLIEIQAEARFYLGLNEQALRLFQEYISNAPNGTRISSTYAFMGEIYLRQGQFRHADIAFSTAVELEKTKAAWWVRLGYAREMAKEYRQSLEAYNRALELDSSLQDASRGKARVLAAL